jgi:tripartite-type tricarboxylate transporter receptor subunit TctC
MPSKEYRSMNSVVTAHTWRLSIATAVVLAGSLAFAETPAPRVLRIVVATSPGGTGDFAARVLAQPLSERLSQQVVVENRAGAGGIIGNDLVAKAAPDGNTLLVGASSLAIDPAVYKKLPYDSLSDFAAITQILTQPLVLLVHPSLPVHSTKELIALAKARPSQIVFASAGTGSTLHLAMELLLQMTGAHMLHVPYKGPGPAVIDCLAGEYRR